MPPSTATCAPMRPSHGASPRTGASSAPEFRNARRQDQQRREHRDRRDRRTRPAPGPLAQARRQPPPAAPPPPPGHAASAAKPSEPAWLPGSRPAPPAAASRRRPRRRPDVGMAAGPAATCSWPTKLLDPARLHGAAPEQEGSGMSPVETIVGLAAACVALALAARTAKVPSAVALVLGGMAVALVPGMPGVELDPHIALALFLPPLLQASAYRTDWEAFRLALRPILLLALGAVLFTAAAVAVVAKLLVPGLALGRRRGPGRHRCAARRRGRHRRAEIHAPAAQARHHPGRREPVERRLLADPLPLRRQRHGRRQRQPDGCRRRLRVVVPRRRAGGLRHRPAGDPGREGAGRHPAGDHRHRAGGLRQLPRPPSYFTCQACWPPSPAAW